MSSSPKRKRLIRRVLIALTIIVLPQLFFQLHVVQGPSMWPAFNDTVTEEWVVSLRDWVASEPDVYEVVVLEDPEDDNGYVLKRLCALPGEFPNVIDGDLRVRDPALGQEWYLKRSLDDIIRTRAPFISLKDLRQRQQGSSWEIVNDRHRCVVPLKGACSLAKEGGFLALEPKANECVLRMPAGQIVDDHKATTNRIVRGKNIVRDLIITFSIFELADADDGLEFELQHFVDPKGEAPAASLSLTTRLASVLVRFQAAGKPLFETSIARTNDLEFRLVLVDDKEALLVRETEQEDKFRVVFERPRAVLPKPYESYLKLLSRGGSVILSRLDIDRDIHYTSASNGAATDNNSRVQSDSKFGRDQYFFLGDNSAQSRDSRYWPANKAHKIVGRPMFVLWPWSRMRALP